MEQFTVTTKTDSILAAAEHLLRRDAEELRESSTSSRDRDDWTGEEEAKADYDEHIAVADALAALTTAAVQPPAIEKQLCDALETAESLRADLAECRANLKRATLLLHAQELAEPVDKESLTAQAAQSIAELLHARGYVQEAGDVGRVAHLIAQAAPQPAEHQQEAQSPVVWPVMPPSKGKSPVLFEDGYAEGWAKCLEACQAALASAPTAQPTPPAVVEPPELSPDFTDTARAALLWVPWHHQGGSSPVGQPIEHQLSEAKRWERLHPANPAVFPRGPDPLSDDTIMNAFCNTPGLSPRQMVSCFIAGARFAEQSHGIGIKKGEGNGN